MSVEAGRGATADEVNRTAWSWRRPEVRAVAYQSLLVAALAFAAWYFISTAAENLQTRRIASGFGFLTREAGFEIGETTIISYSAADTYLKALAAGLAQYPLGRDAGNPVLHSLRRGNRFRSLIAQLALGQNRRRLRRSISQCSIGCAVIFLVRGHHRRAPGAGRSIESVAGAVLQQPRRRVPDFLTDKLSVGFAGT